MKGNRISDLDEQMAWSNEIRYGCKCHKSKHSKKNDESVNSCKGSGNGTAEFIDRRTSKVEFETELLHGSGSELLRPLQGRLVHVPQGWKISDR